MRNRRVSVEEDELESVSPPLRIRHVLIMLGVVALGYALYPRAKAAWLLHDRASAMANYALCMAGPTGPAAFRDRPRHFAKLVRSRLLVTAPDKAPFAECAPQAFEASLSESVRAAHLLPAGTFVEFGTAASQHAVSLEQLLFSASDLAPLLAAAWPFERKGYGRLIRPSIQAKEAPHPMDFPMAGIGSGLPGWRAPYRSTWQEGERWLLAFGDEDHLQVLESHDGGVEWATTSVNQPGIAEHAGRCRSVQAGNKVSFTLSHQDGRYLLTSMFLDEERSPLQLVGVSKVLGFSCDSKVALIAVENQGQQRSLLSCPFGSNCVEVATPARWIATHFDIAQLNGTSVIATIDAGIVRIRSSRDFGRSWTPATVAFDWQSGPPAADIKLPSRLLVLGSRVLLYGAASEGQTYPILVSEDAGASWRAPATSPPPAVVGNAAL